MCTEPTLEHNLQASGGSKNNENRSKTGTKTDSKLNILWNRQKTPLEANFGPILVRNWPNFGPSWAQVGAKLVPTGTQEPLEKDHKTGRKKQANKELSKSTRVI